MKKLADGSLVYDKRDYPPDVLKLEEEGYIQNENDPLHFELQYLPCRHRELKAYGLLSCGRVKGHRDFCGLKQIIVNPGRCKGCEVRMEAKDHFIKLVKDTCLEYGDFTLKSGQKSHFYLDLRKLTLSAGMYFVSEMIDKAITIEADAFGGPETGANQIVGGYLSVVRRPLRGFVVRKEEKGHGKDGLIVGNLNKGDRVIIVEDVTTTGGSVVNAIKAVTEFGGRVVLVLSIIDRQQGARELFEKLGIKFHSILTLEDLEIIKP